jgi:hypothetical protein
MQTRTRFCLRVFAYVQSAGKDPHSETSPAASSDGTAQATGKDSGNLKFRRRAGFMLAVDQSQCSC